MPTTKPPTTEPRHDGDNGNVLRHRIAHLENEIEDLKAWREEVMRDRYVTGKEHKELETEVDNLQTDVARLSERLTVFQAIQVVYSTVASIIGSIIGSVK